MFFIADEIFLHKQAIRHNNNTIYFYYQDLKPNMQSDNNNLGS